MSVPDGPVAVAAAAAVFVELVAVHNSLDGRRESMWKCDMLENGGRWEYLQEPFPAAPSCLAALAFPERLM